jgi:hypothetical protein
MNKLGENVLPFSGLKNFYHLSEAPQKDKDGKELSLQCLCLLCKDGKPKYIVAYKSTTANLFRHLRVSTICMFFKTIKYNF